MTKRKQTLSDVDPGDKLTNPGTGRNSRSDKLVSTHVRELGEAKLQEQLAGGEQLPDDVVATISALCRSLIRLRNQGLTNDGDNARLEDGLALLKKYVKPTTEGRVVQSNQKPSGTIYGPGPNNPPRP
ncbi:hypothetical protein [Spirosoma sp. KUDC1026]|uniref:hypothetical protein n=1 Tax=Spirosoma sp. KUDC1026 TaxID=2745947 RepID=UPI00159BB800|nr:hypothetical protein [Spirosoma sp. KUDC1026]QKZ15174.1 hypothetical protein HU175_22135 [Spirosoma sp. KUDC1026]